MKAIVINEMWQVNDHVPFLVAMHEDFFAYFGKSSYRIEKGSRAERLGPGCRMGLFCTVYVLDGR